MANNGNALSLPDDYAAQLMAGIAQSRATTKISGFGGKDLLRLDVAGAGWVFGQNSEEVQKGSRWAINVRSIMHGWNCWADRGKKNELVLDDMVPVTQAKPPKPEPIEGFESKDTRSFDLKCLDGSDKDLELHFKNGSDGTIRAVDALLGKIYNQVAVNKTYVCPVVTLDQEDYLHPKYNKRIYKPVFNLVGWADMNGNLAGAEQLELDRSLKTPPGSVTEADRSKPAKPPLEAVQPAAEAIAEPVSTVQAHVGQRRRPPVR
jgi:hypothetical protein